jgi:hypothetical protein
MRVFSTHAMRVLYLSVIADALPCPFVIALQKTVTSLTIP